MGRVAQAAAAWPRGLKFCGGGETLGASACWIGAGGNRTPFGDQEPVGRDRECRVVVEAQPSSTLVVVETDLLLQVLEVAPPELCGVDEAVIWVVSGSVESQYLVGAFSPSGHSINNHSSGLGSVRQ